jgi:hypothetical protein
MLYTIRGSGATAKYLEVVRESAEGYEVEITNVGENYTTSTNEYLTRSLFEACIRTGYLSADPPATTARKGA